MIILPRIGLFTQIRSQSFSNYVQWHFVNCNSNHFEYGFLGIFFCKIVGSFGCIFRELESLTLFYVKSGICCVAKDFFREVNF